MNNEEEEKKNEASNALQLKMPKDIVQRVQAQHEAESRRGERGLPLIAEAHREADERSAVIDLIADCANTYDEDDLEQPTYNAHVCKQCASVMWTVQVNTGVSPAMMRCANCDGGNAWSVFYRIRPDILPDGEPRFEWFRPSLRSMQDEGESKQYLKHLVNGGLLLQPRSDLPMLTHGGTFVDADGNEVESTTNILREREFSALKKAYDENETDKKHAAHMQKMNAEQKKALIRKRRRNKGGRRR